MNRKTNCSILPLILTCLVLQLKHAEPNFSGTNLELQEEVVRNFNKDLSVGGSG